MDLTGKMGKGGGDFGARVQIRAHGGSCARTMRSLEDAIRAIGKTGLAFGAARLPRGKGLDVDFAQEKDGDRFVDELRRAGRAPLRVASKTRKLVTHVATCAEILHSSSRGDDRGHWSAHTGPKGEHSGVPENHSARSPAHIEVGPSGQGTARRRPACALFGGLGPPRDTVLILCKNLVSVARGV